MQFQKRVLSGRRNVRMARRENPIIRNARVSGTIICGFDFFEFYKTISNFTSTHRTRRQRQLRVSPKTGMTFGRRTEYRRRIPISSTRRTIVYSDFQKKKF